MNPTIRSLFIGCAWLAGVTLLTAAPLENQVHVESGLLEGVFNRDTGIHRFLGVPFAAPPIGELRWKPPQPRPAWDGTRKADKFGPRAMQIPIFGDMGFRSDGMSEDCLYLNVWTPAKTSSERLPVLVYFYGGGFVAGDGSEGRYDGENMATKGVVTVTVNYRLGVFGFMAHPELTKESPHHASGNYGLLDQQATLVWVKKNIESFGGDPRRVTIAGESAGSISVSAQMASPLSKDFIAGAIGESGSIIGSLSAIPMSEAEEKGVKLGAKLEIGDSPGLAALREIPAEKLMQTAAKAGFLWFNPVVDGYFLPAAPADIYGKGEQAHVPLLAGVNSEEMGLGAVMGRDTPTVENYRKALQRLYPEKAEEVFKLYPAATETEVMDAAQDLSSDRFISYGTWRWAQLAAKTGHQPTYYYLFARPRPAMRPEMGNATAGLAGGVVTNSKPSAPPQPPARGAAHSAEIEYVMGNLNLNKVYAWTPEDDKVSKLSQEYFANFIKTGNPNGPGLPEWPVLSEGKRLVIDVKTAAETTDKLRPRYDFLDQFYLKK
ncbi:MAG TPA: carboxylesterase family protein [Candidatus Limnocylindria bacterium]|nr:carboxylesterase family protein [Candidatus Limnocylindria bacterium]